MIRRQYSNVEVFSFQMIKAEFDENVVDFYYRWTHLFVHEFHSWQIYSPNTDSNMWYQNMHWSNIKKKINENIEKKPLFQCGKIPSFILKISTSEKICDSNISCEFIHDKKNTEKRNAWNAWTICNAYW